MIRFAMWISLCACVIWGSAVACGPTETVGTEGAKESAADGSAGGDVKANDAGPAERTPAPEPRPEPSGPEPTPEPAPGDGAKPGPIQAPADKWTWVDVPESKCGYGTPTGFGVNPSPNGDAKRLFIYLQGGGACWSNKGLIGNCFSIQPSATNLKGYGKANFARENTIRRFFFDRKEANNVFAKDHMVFVPYCTGDVYSGDSQIQSSDGSKTMHFHGHKNMKALLTRLVATFGKVSEVVVSGSSAGGFGASLNWWLVQDMFGDKVKVHLLNDSGPPFEPAAGRFDLWMTTWKSVFPKECPDCTKSAGDILAYYEKRFLGKGHKMGFLSYDTDQVIRLFFNLNATKFKERLYLLYDKLDKLQNVKYFGLKGSSHTMMGGAKTLKNKSGAVLGDWVKAMLEGGDAWKNYRE